MAKIGDLLKFGKYLALVEAAEDFISKLNAAFADPAPGIIEAAEEAFNKARDLWNETF